MEPAKHAVETKPILRAARFSEQPVTRRVGPATQIRPAPIPPTTRPTIKTGNEVAVPTTMDATAIRHALRRNGRRPRRRRSIKTPDTSDASSKAPA